MDIYTTATSGVVSTQYYGQKFKSELVEKKINIVVYVNPPESVSKNKNVTLHFSLEKVSMTGLDTVKMEGLGYLDADQTTAYTNCTPPIGSFVELSRHVSSEDVKQQKLDLMPGFRLTWWYTGAEVTPERKYKDTEMTKYFVR